MTAVHARSALLANGWADDVRLRLEDGKIVQIETGVAASDQDERCAVIVPAMPNLHSHAFQRAMAGLAEVRGHSTDSFWSWRTTMYRFAHQMSPDHVEAVASQLYMEMVEAGFSRVGEFHYLHNDVDGRHYGNISELAERIVAASVAAGINITLLPVFYAHSGFGGQQPSDGQRRFIHSVDSFARLMEACSQLLSSTPRSVLGIAPHSLRAVTPSELAVITPLAGDGPIHIHVAEQTKEVEDCIAHTGVRPVEWLLDNAHVDSRWCFIHATHMTPDETVRAASSGVVAGLCPITEANLGDGVFDAPRFIEAKGRFGIGSDSNISISLPEELRTLEYSQRLFRRERNVIAASGSSTGRILFDEAVRGGSTALQSRAGLTVDGDADLISLKVDDVDPLRQDALLDLWIFANGVKIDSVWAGGIKQVENGRHRNRDRIQSRFRSTMRELLQS
jgi:formimidoylglutamate deiminase